MLRMNRSLTRVRLQAIASPSQWICRSCQIHGSAMLRARALEEIQFPATRTRRGKQLRVDDTMSDEERQEIIKKKQREHANFIKRIKEYIATRSKVAKKAAREVKEKKEVKGPKTPIVVQGIETRRVERAQDILKVAKLFTITPDSWPTLNKKAITGEQLLLMHAAIAETLKTMPDVKTSPKSWVELAAHQSKEAADLQERIKATEERRKAGKLKNPASNDPNSAEKESTWDIVENSSEKEVKEETSVEEHSEGGSETAEKKPRKTAKEKKLEVDAVTINAGQFELKPIDIEQNVELRPLNHGLDRVLFNPGVTFLRDPRSRVYNFDPYLDSIMPVDEFDFDALGDYITSSKDTTLIDLARAGGHKYVGSTSSMTGILSHLHYLLSRWRPLNLKMLSKGFVTESDNFTRLSRLPVSVILKWKDGVYAIDQDKEVDSLETVLLFLGRSMEKMLTLPPEVFQKYHKSESHQIPEEVKNARERYHYTSFGDLVFRSQLDAHDDRLPGTGVFDLKTRGVISVRMNASEPAVGWGYQIKTADGQFESFEREYYDLIRSAFMKYSLQVRMGRMDGCFVAYHNTKRIFGFQYISIDEMDEALHGSSEVGDQEFKLSLKLLNEALDKATQKYPEQSLRLWFETREAAMPFLYFAAEPISEEDLKASQEREADLNVVIDQIKRSMNRSSEGNASEEEIEREELRRYATQSGPAEEALNEILEEDEARENSNIEKLQESSEMLESITVGGEKLIDPERQAELVQEERKKTGWEYLTGPEKEAAESASQEAVEDSEVAADATTEEAVEATTEEAAEATEEPSEELSEEASAEATTHETPEEDSGERSDEESAEVAEKSSTEAAVEPPFVQVLVVQNTLNGEKVDRPETLREHDTWAVNYAFLDMEGKAATRTMASIKKRKYDGVEFEANWQSVFMKHLIKLSKQGEEYAARQRKEDEEGDIVIYKRRA